MGIRGKVLADRVEALRDELTRTIDVHTPVELHVGDRQTDGARRAHAPHAGNAVHRSLDGERYVLLDLIGGEPGRLGHDHDRRRVQFREDIHWRARQLECRECDQNA